MLQNVRRLSLGLGRNACLAGLVAAFALGCASADEEGGSHGGQTGSLVPDCRLVPAVVPAGTTAFIAYGDSERCPELFSQTELVDGLGQPIEFSFEMLDVDVYRAVSSQELMAGQYSVRETALGQVSDRPLTVTPEQAAPVALGTLTAKSSTCRVWVTIAFDDSLVPFLPLVQLEAHAAAGQSLVVAEFGQLPADAPAFSFPLDLCGRSGCSDEKPVLVGVSAVVAGLPGLELSAEVSLTVSCPEPAQATSCALADAPLRGSPSHPAGWLGIATCAGWLRRRRSAGSIERLRSRR